LPTTSALAICIVHGVYRTRDLPGGKREHYRPKFDARVYTVPERELAGMREWIAEQRTYGYLRDEYHAELSDWNERGRFERDGNQWVIVAEPAYDYAVEIALVADGTIVDIQPVAPERAYQLARASDPPHVFQED
jgi:hypothetical protein